MSRYDYAWRCDCETEGIATTLQDAADQSQIHLKEHTDKTPNWYVFIDQYDLIEGELSGKYWKLKKNNKTPVLCR